MMLDILHARELRGGKVVSGRDEDWRLEIPTISEGQYTLAQIDDYMHLPRGRFPHQSPISLELEARLSSEVLQGTWGFGFWNDPFSFGSGPGGMSRTLPVLPNAAWFFYGSDQNYLSLNEDQPANGFHAKVFKSPRVPSVFSLVALPILPFLLWPAAGQVMRKAARKLVKEDGCSLSTCVTEWHTYRLEWYWEKVRFEIDQQEVFSTHFCPTSKMGLVIWIDNQYLRFEPDGKFNFGFSPTHTKQFLEFRNLKLISE